MEQNTWIHFSEYTRPLSRLLKKYVMGVWSDNFTAAFFVSFIVTVCVHDIEGIQKKVIAYH